MYRKDDIIFCGVVSGLYWRKTFDTVLPTLFDGYADLWRYPLSDYPYIIGEQYCTLIHLSRLAGVDLRDDPYYSVQGMSWFSMLVQCYTDIPNDQWNPERYHAAIGVLALLAFVSGFTLEQCVDTVLAPYTK